MPAGKFQRSPAPTSSMKLRPCLSTAVIRGAAGEHVGPLGLLVPVQLADPTGLQPHVDAGHLRGDRQLAHRHLARPAAGAKAVARGGEGELEVGNGAGVGIRRGEQVGVLALQGNVTRPQDRRAPGSPNWLSVSVRYCLFSFVTDLDTHVGVLVS